jgi:hypothetical protein
MHSSVSPGITETGINPAGSEKLPSIGVIMQSADYPALAALYLHQSNELNGRSIFSSRETFRELEAGVDAASQIIYGDATAGRTYRNNPEQLELVKQTIMTVV